MIARVTAAFVFDHVSLPRMRPTVRLTRGEADTSPLLSRLAFPHSSARIISANAVTGVAHLRLSVPGVRRLHGVSIQPPAVHHVFTDDALKAVRRHPATTHHATVPVSVPTIDELRKILGRAPGPVQLDEVRVGHRREAVVTSPPQLSS